MLGFELNIGQNCVAAKIQKRCITIILEKVDHDFFLKFSGSDFTKDESLLWYESQFNEGKAVVHVKEIYEESIPSRVRSVSDAALLTEEEQTKQNKKNLYQYRLLREELLKRQLIVE